MNNSGKTTVIESLTIRKDHKIRSSEKHGTNGPEFILWGDDGEIKRKAFLLRPESNTIGENPELPSGEIFEVVSSRRHWESNAQSTVDTNSTLAQSGLRFSRGNQNIETAAILKNIEKNQGEYEAFIPLVKRIIPEF